MIQKPQWLDGLSRLFVEAAAPCQAADRGPAFPIFHLWTQPLTEKTDLRSGFTGLLIWSPQLCTQINGSVYFLLSEVEQGCGRAEMKQRGLMRSFTSTPFIPLQRRPPPALTFTPAVSPIPSTMPPRSSLCCLFRFITRLPVPLVGSPAHVAEQRGQRSAEESDASFLNEVTPTLVELTWGQAR